MSNLALLQDEVKPQFVRTRSNIVIDTSTMLWSYRDSALTVRCDFETLQPILSTAFLENFKDIMRWHIQHLSDSTVYSVFSKFKLFLQWCHIEYGVVDIITGDMYLNYVNSKGLTQSSSKNTIKACLQRWSTTSIPGLSEDIMTYVRKVKIERPKSGLGVRTMDPLKGPFTDIELSSIQGELTKGYANGKIALKDYLLVSLFITLGMRPIQYAALKVEDLFTSNSNGRTSYFIKMPRAKQQQNLRDSFSIRAITPAIGQLLMEYKEFLLKDYSKYSHSEKGPLFKQSDTLSQLNTPLKASDQFKDHSTSKGIQQKLVQILSKLNVFSERTGEAIHISSRRFRQTIGTRAAEEGHGEMIIAELLDHSTTHNVGVYVQSTPAILKRIDKAMALQMAPMAQAFHGLLVENKDAAVRGADSNSFVLTPDYTNSFKPIGNCGSFDFCKTGQALACYTCNNFQPWVDGEHEKVLNALLADRERLTVTTDQRIASVNDRLILAVAEVVRLCTEYTQGATND